MEEKDEIECLTESLERVKMRKEKLGLKSRKECIGVKLLEKGIAAVILDDYDDEVGYAG